ncbi:MAG: ABC transporter ATP-binding protein [archaeon GB-1867-097]|nr:ABC transporter ATP-binding protein [Candidatus Culexmicrobium thermophilum]
MGNDVLITKDLRGQYRASFGTIYAVDGISLKVRKGEILGLVGESGCGKSTFLRLLTGVVDPPLYYESGEVIIVGKNGKQYSIYRMQSEELRREVAGKLISYVPQSTFDALNPCQRIRDFIADMLREHTGKKYSSDDIHKMLRDHLSMLGLNENVLDKYPHELSGGMKQRTVVAISTYLKPAILLLDEPTSALDVSSQRRLIELLINLHRKKTIETMIISSHDITVLRQMCDRIAVMYAGKLVELGDTENIIYEPLHPYTKGLINSFLPLEADIRYKKLTGIPGRPPELTSRITHCRFYPRCPYAMEVCKLKEPPILENESNRFVACWLYEEGER